MKVRPIVIVNSNKLWFVFFSFIIAISSIVKSNKIGALDKQLYRGKKNDFNRYKKPLKFGTFMKHKIPIIAILAYYDKSSGSNNSTFQAKIDDSYVYWLQSGGSQVIPILPWMDEKTIKSILDSCNGILFQNTDDAVKIDLEGNYERTARIIYNKIKSLNENKVYFPILAIGNGANLMQALEAATNEIIFNYSDYGTPITLRPIEFIISDLRRIRMIYFFDGKDVNNIQKLNTTAHYTPFGVSADSYSKIVNLNKMFKVLALATYLNKNEKVSNDRLETKSKKFVSMFEAYRYPIYGITFDPARYSFNRYNENQFDYSNEAITISQKILNFFIKECYKSLFKKVSKEKFINNEINLLSRKFDGIDIVNKLPNKIKQNYYYTYSFDHPKDVNTDSNLKIKKSKNNKNSNTNFLKTRVTKNNSDKLLKRNL